MRSARNNKIKYIKKMINEISLFYRIKIVLIMNHYLSSKQLLSKISNERMKKFSSYFCSFNNFSQHKQSNFIEFYGDKLLIMFCMRELIPKKYF